MKADTTITVKRRVDAAGRTFNIAPVPVGRLPAFLAAVEPIARELAHGDLLAALARNADSVIEAVAIGAGCERAWLDEQEADVLVDLGAAVVEVNADFFARRLLPMITQAADRLEETMTHGGETGSLNSPASGLATGT